MKRDDDVRCFCDRITGEECEWYGRPRDTVLVEHIQRLKGDAPPTEDEWARAGAYRVAKAHAQRVVERNPWTRLVRGVAG